LKFIENRLRKSKEQGTSPWHPSLSIAFEYGGGADADERRVNLAECWDGGRFQCLATILHISTEAAAATT